MKSNKCENCNATENLTKHHVKNSRGRITGHVSILCDPCHRAVEEEYRREGKIIPYSTTPKITHNEQLQLDYMSGLLPYYSLGKSK